MQLRRFHHNGAAHAVVVDENNDVVHRRNGQIIFAGSMDEWIEHRKGYESDGFNSKYVKTPWITTREVA